MNGFNPGVGSVLNPPDAVWHKFDRLLVPSADDDAPDGLRKLRDDCKRESQLLESDRGKFVAQRKELAAADAGELAAADFKAIGALRTKLAKLLARELAWRRDYLSPLLRGLRADVSRQRSVAIERHQAELARVRAGLTKLGYDMSKPMHAGMATIHPGVKALKAATSRDGGSVQQASMRNSEAIDNIESTLRRLASRS